MTTKYKSFSTYPKGTAANAGLVNCLTCYGLSAASETHCKRCGASISIRQGNSLQVTLSLLISAIILYIPANIYPIMTTVVLGDVTQSTILGGVVLFIESGSYFVAAVIFIASVLVPVGKILALSYLCYQASSSKRIAQKELTYLYRVTEFVGKWSMVDVFVVAILVALIQLGELMNIEAGIATSAFASVVILTMISAHRFDTRLLWDKLEGNTSE